LFLQLLFEVSAQTLTLTLNCTKIAWMFFFIPSSSQ